VLLVLFFFSSSLVVSRLFHTAPHLSSSLLPLLLFPWLSHILVFRVGSVCCGGVSVVLVVVVSVLCLLWWCRCCACCGGVGVVLVVVVSVLHLFLLSVSFVSRGVVSDFAHKGWFAPFLPSLLFSCAAFAAMCVCPCPLSLLSVLCAVVLLVLVLAVLLPFVSTAITPLSSFPLLCTPPLVPLAVLLSTVMYTLSIWCCTFPLCFDWCPTLVALRVCVYPLPFLLVHTLYGICWHPRCTPLHPMLSTLSTLLPFVLAFLHIVLASLWSFVGSGVCHTILPLCTVPCVPTPPWLLYRHYHIVPVLVGVSDALLHGYHHVSHVHVAC